MTHRFPIKEIARQAGLGTATIDRVLNHRANVSPQTRARVARAIDELKGQEAQLSARGRRLIFDFIIESPARFSAEIRRAVDDVAPTIMGASCQVRFHVHEVFQEQDVINLLSRIQKRGSHGLCIKLRNTRAIRAKVKHLALEGLAIVTLATDISLPEVRAYLGLDNAGAGRSAAYLIAQCLRGKTGTILATRSHEMFQGEEAREVAFNVALAEFAPHFRLIHAKGGGGVDQPTRRLLLDVLHQTPELAGVYSMGGGNRAILGVLDNLKLKPQIYVAHDLDRENKVLLARRHIDFVLHHDLRVDIANVFSALLEAHGLAAKTKNGRLSTAQIITPENLPPDIL